MALFKVLIIFAVGMAAIVKGADWFTDASVWIAEKTGIPKVIIGATIVSLATTLPEFAVSVYASYLNYSDMSLGNAIGSNIFNIGMILGISLIIRNFSTDPSFFSKQSFFMIFAGVIAFLFSLNRFLGRFEGFMLVLILFSYLIFLASYYKNRTIHREPDSTIRGTVSQNILKFLAGSASVVIGSRLAVNSGIQIAEFFGVSELIIGLTLVAVGTSLPELVTSLTATIKGYQELSVGNIIGAGLLNMSWVVGVSAIVNPIPITRNNLILDFPFMLLLMGLLIIFGRTKNRLMRWEGIVLLAVYAAYVTVLFRIRL